MNTMTLTRTANIIDAIIRHADLTSTEVEALRALQQLALREATDAADIVEAWMESEVDERPYDALLDLIACARGR